MLLTPTSSGTNFVFEVHGACSLSIPSISKSSNLGMMGSLQRKNKGTQVESLYSNPLTFLESKGMIIMWPISQSHFHVSYLFY